MSTPVTTDDVVQGCVKFLKVQTDVQGVLGSYDDNTPWVFQDFSLVTVEQTSSVVAVVWYAGGWAGANPHNTMAFPRIGLDLYADPQRVDANATRFAETRLRVVAAYKVIDRHLHMVDGQAYWGTVRICGSTRLSEPAIDPVTDTDGVLRLQVFYGVEEG
jgi:hypothetical protein